MGTLPNDFNEGPFSVYAGAVNFTICGPGGFSYPVDSERYAWHYVQLLNEAYAAWVTEAEQSAAAQSALIAIATKETERRVSAIIEAGNAMSVAMYQYQMDVDFDPPQKHRDIMDRWENAVKAMNP